ncbi:hypothetical protein RJE46_12890 [Cedecea neteri]|uniref:hypothetical protein n=1 Tax=Cedecea neteri TaxID=158822 RepID=UPI00155EB009|nr:hypothetical protein [Cedecea neteri]NIG73725.1 hypothetical protein [Klebsiella sp. Ap-873]WNJ77537.1 hypothetical protein RJE46_12890 [Cedecea neteri]
MKKTIVISMLSSLMVFLPLTSSAAKKIDSIQSIQTAANQACSGNPDKSGCERLVWITAKVAMMNTSFYLQSCSNKEKIAKENKASCDEAERLLSKINSTK